MAAVIESVLTVARSKLGVAEAPPGSNQVEFSHWAGIPGQPWCAAFVSWCLTQAEAMDVPPFVYCPTGAAAYKKAGRFGAVPTLGSVVFFQWPGSDRVCHVGLVEAVRADSSVVTIEGNTDERGGGSGGKVMRHVRRTNIAGYGYPQYAAMALDPKVTPGFTTPIVMRPIVDEYVPPEGGVVLVADNGDTYAYGGAQYPGTQSRRSHDPVQFEPIVDQLQGPTGGVLLLATSGAVYALMGAPYQGGANGKDYFRGRTAARLEATTDGRYAIVALSGERYGPGF
ncbi:MAG TPA: CHAP domain-containing protein [Acidimicrobiia bacterium]|nr:CHAP domain-containing protein [Acidimicrobiia bacterium]